MTAIDIRRDLQKLRDVDDTNIADGRVPVARDQGGGVFVHEYEPMGGGGAGFSLGLSTLGNTLGQTGVTGSRIVLAGIGAATLSQLTDANGATISVSSPVQTEQTQSRFNLTLAGNTAGVLALVSSGVLTLAGGNRVTLSQNGNAVTVSGPPEQTGISSIVASDATFTQGSVQFTGSGIITIRSSANQRVVVDASQSVQTQNMVAVTLSGNTSGAQALISSGTLTLAGGNNITVSQNGNAVTISGPNVGGAQTGISGIIASDATYTSGTVRFTGVGGGVTVSSNTGQRVDISVAAPVAQTDQTLGMYALGNTTAQSSSTTLDARTVSIRGDGIVSVGYSNGSLRISASQSVQTQSLFSAGISNLGNTGGDTGVTGTRMVLVGSSNITLSQATGAAGATVSIIGAAGGGGSGESMESDITQTAHGLAVGDWVRLDGTNYVLAQADTAENAEVVGVVSAIADANNFTLTTGGLVTGLSGLTAGDVYWLSPDTAGDITNTEPTGDGQISKPVFIARTTTSGYVFNMRGAVIETNPQMYLAGVSSVGNTSGDTGITGSRLVLAGTNGITLSQSTNASGGTVTISGATQTVQTQNLHNVTLSGNTAGVMAHISSGTMTLAGGNNITLSQNGNAVTISGPNTVAQTNQTIGMYAVGNTTAQSSSTTMDARTLSVRGDGIVSVGYSGGTLRISATEVAQTNQTLGLYAVQNTTAQSSSTTVDARTLSIAGDGAVSVGYSAGSLRISAPVQTVQTQGILSAGVSNVGNTAGNTQVSTGSRLVLAGAGIVTLSQATAAGASTITVSATQSAQTIGMYAVQNTTAQSSSTTMDARTLSVAGDGAVSVGYSAGSLRISAPVQTVESQSIGMSNVGNTSGTTGMASGGQVRFVFAGGNNITLSQSLNGASGTITISAPNLGAGAMSAGASNLGNTAGATGITGTQLVLVGSDNITLSQTTGANGGTLSILGHPAFSAGVSTGGNTAGDTGVSGTRMVLVGTGPISLSQATAAAGNTVSINAPATSSLVGTNGVSISTNGSTISVMDMTRTFFAPFDESPMVTGQQGQASLHVMPMYIPNLQFDRIALGIQISNASNSSGSITLSNWVGIYTRNASTISLVSSTSISTNFSGSGTVGSYSLYGGPRHLTIPWTMTLTGSDYYVGIVSRTTTGGAAGHSLSQLLQSKFTNSAWSGILGAASTATAQRLLGQGVWSATTSGMPASIAFSHLSGTGSDVLRSPIFHLRSGTV